LLMAFAVLANGLVYALVSSRIGRALRAIKLNEPLAQSQCINPVSYRLLAVVLSAFLAGAMGGMFVFYLGIVDPTIFDFYYTETMLIMVVIGGPGSFWWVLTSTAILTVLPDALDIAPDVRMVLYGTILVATMLALPGGIGGWFAARRIDRWRKRPYGGTTQSAQRHE
jgi:branched-chain amino acid transport system permease protein